MAIPQHWIKYKNVEHKLNHLQIRLEKHNVCDI